MSLSSASSKSLSVSKHPAEFLAMLLAAAVAVLSFAQPDVSREHLRAEKSVTTPMPMPVDESAIAKLLANMRLHD